MKPPLTVIVQSENCLIDLPSSIHRRYDYDVDMVFPVAVLTGAFLSYTALHKKPKRFREVPEMLKVELSKENAVSFGLAALLPFLVHYGASTFVPPPKYEDYHIKNYVDGEATSKEERIKLEKEQEALYTAERAAEKRFEERHFLVAVPIGLAALIVGSLLSSATVGAGLMYGGLFTLTEGMWGQWRELPDGQIFALLLVAVSVIVTIGYRRLPGDQSESKSSPRATPW